MKNTAAKKRTKDTTITLASKKVASKTFAANTQQKGNLKPKQSCISTANANCMQRWQSAVGVECFCHLRSSLRQISIFPVCVGNTRSDSAKVIIIVEKLAAKTPITPYFREQKDFFLRNARQYQFGVKFRL